MPLIHINAIDEKTLREEMGHVLSFPYRAHTSDLKDCPNLMFPWHWHREVEFFYLRQGTVVYDLPGESIRFEAGQGGFLNSNVLHRTRCLTGGGCTQEEQQFLPEFLSAEGTRIMERYIRPVTTGDRIRVLRFDPTVPAQQEILEVLCQAFALEKIRPEGYELQLQQLLLKLWQKLYLFVKDDLKETEDCRPNQEIKKILSYIADHYAEHITLQQLAAAAHISPRACDRMFQGYLKTTPFAYLQEYRIDRACSLLRETALPISEVAIRSGFGAASYFGKLFREKMGMTPMQYRNRTF